MILHAVVVSWNRQRLTRLTIESFLSTAPPSATLVVVDNGSDDPSWLVGDPRWDVILLGENLGPGAAANRGWSVAPPDATALLRLDNDVELQPGWALDAFLRFSEPSTTPLLYGLTAPGDEEWTRSPRWPTGGNAIVSRSLFTRGLRYSEEPWRPGRTECGQFCADALRLGARQVWSPPALMYLWDGDEEYRRSTHAARGVAYPGAPTGPGWRSV